MASYCDEEERSVIPSWCGGVAGAVELGGLVAWLSQAHRPGLRSPEYLGALHNLWLVRSLALTSWVPSPLHPSPTHPVTQIVGFCPTPGMQFQLSGGQRVAPRAGMSAG